MQKYILRIYKNKSTKLIQKLFNKKFNTNVSNVAIRSYLSNHKLKTGHKQECKYSNKQIEFIKNNVDGITLKDLTSRFNKKFNTNITEGIMSNLKTKYQLRSGITGGQFNKGHIPFNKGTKGIMKANKTSFKKGNIPTNRKPIGYERVNVDGYTEVKVKQPNVFKLKHRIIYESKYGNIPAGYKVIFADRDKSNFDINNLILVSNSQELIMNKNNLIKKGNIEFTKTGKIIAEVIDKSNKLVKKG